MAPRRIICSYVLVTSMVPNLMNLIRFGDIHGNKAYKLVGFGDIRGNKAY